MSKAEKEPMQNYPHQLIVADHTKDWKIVLKDPVGQNVVLYNRLERKYVVCSGPQVKGLFDQGPGNGFCPMCGQEVFGFGRNGNGGAQGRSAGPRADHEVLDPQVTPDYFRLIDTLPQFYNSKSAGGESLRAEAKVRAGAGEAGGGEGSGGEGGHSGNSRFGSSLPTEAFNDGYYKRFFDEKKELGRGSFGSVYMCHHKLQGVVLGSFAVKKIPVGDSTTWCLKILQEVTILQTLQHPNITSYKHSWIEHHKESAFTLEVPTLFVLMEYADRGNLASHIFPHGVHRPRILDDTTIWNFLLDICKGLHHLHLAGLIHRDLKPENILIKSLNNNNHTGPPTPSNSHSPSPTAAAAAAGSSSAAAAAARKAARRGDRKRRGGGRWGEDASGADGRGHEPVRLLISDFGQTYFKGTTLRRPGFRGVGHYGTLLYVAPEALLEDPKFPNPYTEASDLWSVGAMLYVMAYSKFPFEGDDAETLKREIYRQSPLDLDKLKPPRPKAMKNLIQGLLSADPSSRLSLPEVMAVATEHTAA
eukprot:CAMPEP_0167778194 /NCGR_PEP_ID=MMETSP0111_2-20121227/4120_1 /TAXON_ID=91324 /ORGANISM="Lotharella globosa, Strain CCCM811" /LENGTH=530 /DNA_ID=CAMNT_0007668475 /DNA_START=108 /DNA_END=1697 /DNA_ORIENTATION=+